MAKKPCVNCRKDLGLFSFKTAISDGVICASCLESAGIKTLGNPLNYDTVSLLDLINKRKRIIANFNPNKKVGTYLSIDETNKIFKFDKEIFEFSNLLDYEVLEDGESISKGGLGRAVAGGLLFGGVGAIVGGVTGGKKSSGICTSLKIRITLRNAHCDSSEISFICSETKKSGFIYKAVKESAQDCISALQIIIDQCQSEAVLQSPAQTIVQSPVSSADEIMKFKNLLDQGIITQEEFNKKKAELLGL